MVAKIPALLDLTPLQRGWDGKEVTTVARKAIQAKGLEAKNKILPGKRRAVETKDPFVERDQSDL